MYDSAFPYILGVFLAWVTWYPARSLSTQSEKLYFATIIAVVALGFLAFPIEQGNLKGITYESVALALIVVLIVLSYRAMPTFLAAAFFLHGAWDLAYLLGAVALDKPGWVVQLCVPYDWLLAAYLFRRASTWRAAFSSAGP